MCGIAGLVSQNPIEYTMRAQVATLGKLLHHRGPDSAGEFGAEHVAMTMRRLSIIDVSGGNQPIFNETSTVVVICNGEIYNYIELMRDLSDRGHYFQTNSDVETIVHLYEDFGADCVNFLRGMFAFALWDSEKRRFLLARDRIGEKPLYLCSGQKSIYFASELKALLNVIPDVPELEPSAVDLFLHYQYVPEPLTLFKTIRKLPAAHRMIINVDSWEIQEQRYWNPLEAPPIEGNPAEIIRAELETVSKLIIRSDVSVGIALSGGLDSGAVALLSAPKYPDTMHAFSVGYPGNLPNDERPQAKWLAKRLSLPFHDVELTTRQMVDFFPKLMWASDDPVADIAAFPQYAVMDLASQHGVKVMLSGLGGDELFWGYQWVVSAVAKTQNSWHAGGVKKIIRTRHRVSSNQLVFYNLERGFIAFENWKNHLYSSQMKREIQMNNAYLPFSITDFSAAPISILITRAIFETWLVGNCISLGDRLSMASSVELRLPLVDYRLVETVFGLRRINDDYLLSPKAWLKAALQDVLPQEMISRPKQGFAPPGYDWIDALIERYSDSVESGVLVRSGMIKRDMVKKLLKSTYHKRNWDWSITTYKLLVFEMWYSVMTAHHAQPA